MVERIIRLGSLEQKEKTNGDHVHCVDRSPVLPENVKTDSTVSINVRVIDGGVQSYFRSFIRVLLRCVYVESILALVPVRLALIF